MPRSPGVRVGAREPRGVRLDAVASAVVRPGPVRRGRRRAPPVVGGAARVRVGLGGPHAVRPGPRDRGERRRDVLDAVPDGLVQDHAGLLVVMRGDEVPGELLREALGLAVDQGPVHVDGQRGHDGVEAAGLRVRVGEDVADHPLGEADGREAGDVRLGAWCALNEVVLAVQVLIEVLDPFESVSRAGFEHVCMVLVGAPGSVEAG